MRWIVLLRGVNVGGHGKTPMAELRQHLSDAGAVNVVSYIQSGNLIFDHPKEDAATVANWTSDLIEARFGHHPPALAWSKAEIDSLIAGNPFPETADPKLVHFHLFRDTPAPGAIDRLSTDLNEGEVLHLSDTCLYHWPPGGFGRSKIAQKIPRALGVTTTARNLNSMRRILDLA